MPNSGAKRLNMEVWQESTDNARHTDHGAVSDL
jgi:hypothetical protein